MKPFYALILLILALSGCAAFTASAQKEPEALMENQREVYGKVTQADGNEITLAIGTPASAVPEKDAEESDASPREGPPGGMGPGGSAPDMPEGGSEEMPGEGFGEGRGRRNTVELTLTGEEETWLIPVGTPVYLSTGEDTLTTNFMQIMVENTLCLVVQDNGGKETVVRASILN